MFEWDCASYNRKFGYSIANCRVGAENASWQRISEISQEGLVFVRDGDDAIGEVTFESNNVKKQTKYPLLTFNYVPIEAGVYAHRTRPDWFFVLQRRHLKSFKIGLSAEGYEIWEFTNTGPIRKDYKAEINLDKPLDKAEFKKYKILNHNLVLEGKTLRAYGDTIGFLEAGRAILKDPAFKPLVKPYLGDAWEIVDL